MPRVNLNQSSSIVTGGASGIGSCTPAGRSGLQSRNSDLNEERGQQVADEVVGLFVKCDVTKTEDADVWLPPPRNSLLCEPAVFRRPRAACAHHRP